MLIQRETVESRANMLMLVRRETVKDLANVDADTARDCKIPGKHVDIKAIVASQQPQIAPDVIDASTVMQLTTRPWISQTSATGRRVQW